MISINGCLSSAMRRIGGVLSSLRDIAHCVRARIERVGSFLCACDRVGGIQSSARFIGTAMVVSYDRVCDIKSRIGLVCSPNLGLGVLWASDGRSLDRKSVV
mgnify:CR=1 FL=1